MHPTPTTDNNSNNQYAAVIRLQLNADKTEVMWCTSTRRLSQLPSHPLSVAGANVYPVSVVRDQESSSTVTLVRPHVHRTVSHCFGTLRQLRHLRRYITDDLLPSLVVSLIHSRLDCGNFILVGYQLTYSDTFSL